MAKKPAQTLQDELQAPAEGQPETPMQDVATTPAEASSDGASDAKPKARKKKQAKPETPPVVEPEGDTADANDAGPDKVQFHVSLPGTCGHGTIRPPFLVEFDFSGDPDDDDQVQPLDVANPNNGVRIVTALSDDPFKAGAEAGEKARVAFDRHYGISDTDHKYKIDRVEN